MSEIERLTIQRLFIRICRDSQFKIAAVDAAILVGKMLKRSPLDVWIAVGDLDKMDRIADGTHGCLILPQYQTVPTDPLCGAAGS